MNGMATPDAALDVTLNTALDEVDAPRVISTTANASVVATVSVVPSLSRLRSPHDESTQKPAIAFASADLESPLAFAHWRPNPLALPEDAPYANGDAPLVVLLPTAAICVLLLLLTSWGHMRRSRRRGLERQQDAWVRDVNIIEAAYY